MIRDGERECMLPDHRRIREHHHGKASRWHSQDDIVKSGEAAVVPDDIRAEAPAHDPSVSIPAHGIHAAHIVGTLLHARARRHECLIGRCLQPSLPRREVIQRRVQTARAHGAQVAIGATPLAVLENAIVGHHIARATRVVSDGASARIRHAVVEGDRSTHVGRPEHRRRHRLVERVLRQPRNQLCEEYVTRVAVLR